MENKFSQKLFLNKDGFNSIAAIGINITVPDEKDIYFEGGEILISDCNRQISLDLDFSSKEEIDNSLFKLHRIINICVNTLGFIKSNKKRFEKAIEIKNKKRDEKDNI